MIPAIILAAGASRRLGEPKQLLRHQGQTLLRRAVAAAGACAPVLVVTGCRAEAMAAELAGLAVMANLGGAVVPFLMGWTADLSAVRWAFLVPLGALAYVTALAWRFRSGTA